jgi:5-methylcytosine-specific restriction endonuclease McrA
VSDRSYQWERLAVKFRAYCRSRNALCHICIARGDIENAQIDYHAKRFSPNSFEVDHVKPWSLYPQLRYEWRNLAASHSRCNRQRRDELLAPAGQVWVKTNW